FIFALMNISGGIFSTTTFTINYYRNRDGLNVWSATYSKTPPPGGFNTISFWSWIGWLSDDSFVSTYPTYRELQENGNYHVTINVTGGFNFFSSGNFIIAGMPAHTSIFNDNNDGFDWAVRLTDYFDSSNYIRAGICSQPFSDGQSAEPQGIMAVNYAHSSNEGCATDGHIW